MTNEERIVNLEDHVQWLNEVVFTLMNVLTKSTLVIDPLLNFDSMNKMIRRKPTEGLKLEIKRRIKDLGHIDFDDGQDD